MTFRDRRQAGQELAARLTRYKDMQPVILALPRGGVPVAVEVADALDAPLDLVLVRKIGVPWQPELAMGAVVDGGAPVVVRKENVVHLAGITEAEFKSVCDRELAEIERRRRIYFGDRDRIEVAGCTAIIIDDGIATGATTQAALRATRMRKPRKLILAVPVGPKGIIEEMSEEADKVICLEEHADFYAIGLYYREFQQVDDAEVIEMLARYGHRHATSDPDEAAD